MDANERTLVQQLESTRGLVLVVSGAGLSLASGIPTFRGPDPGAVWAKDVTEMATFAYFSAEPEGSWRWYLSRFEKARDARPNPGHHALVQLERWRASRGLPFLVVTQNIDGLHRAAGASELVEVHGSAHRVRCSRDGCELGAPAGTMARTDVDFSTFLADPRRANVPACPKCRAPLRAHVLWFDEVYTGHRDYQWRRVLEAAATAELVLFVGTSFSVGVTELIVSEALDRSVPVYSIDPAGSPHRRIVPITRPAEVCLVEMVNALPGGPTT